MTTTATNATTTMTRRRGFDVRGATLWLLIGAIGVGTGASLRIWAPPPQADPGARLVAEADTGTQIVVLRTSPLAPDARTRGS